MNEHEQMMCELQGEFFELSVERLKCGSAIFAMRFMHSEIAKDLDNIDDPYNFVSPNNLISIMKRDFPKLESQVGQKYPPHVMKWIGYIYRAWNIIKRERSARIYELIKIEKMAALYDTFHTFDPSYCVERLEEIANEQRQNPKSDYEIFKEIMMSK